MFDRVLEYTYRNYDIVEVHAKVEHCKVNGRIYFSWRDNYERGDDLWRLLNVKRVISFILVRHSLLDYYKAAKLCNY